MIRTKKQKVRALRFVSVGSRRGHITCKSHMDVNDMCSLYENPPLLLPSGGKKGSMLTTEHEVDVALFLLKTKWKPQISLQRTWREFAASPHSFSRWRSLSAENRNFLARPCYCCREWGGGGVSQVYRASSIKPLTKNSKFCRKRLRASQPCAWECPWIFSLSFGV